MSIQEKYRGKAPLPPDTRRRMSLLPPLFAQHRLRLVYLFGSAADETSKTETCQDIDLAIMPRDAFAFRAFYADVSQTLQTDRLDIVDMRYAPISLLFTIVSHHRRLNVKALFLHSKSKPSRSGVCCR